MAALQGSFSGNSDANKTEDRFWKATSLKTVGY